MSFFSDANVIAAVYTSVLGQAELSSPSGDTISILPLEVADYDVYLADTLGYTMVVLLSTDGDMMMPDKQLGIMSGGSVASNDICCNMSVDIDDGKNVLTASQVGFMMSVANAGRVEVSVHNGSSGFVDAVGLAFM